ncbi:MAG TPA: CoA transferase [Bryobacteraceae bacterium]|nr:CoA transferase [Bryobacteraceae bacterium]
MTQQALPRPLEDVTVLDLTLALAGPFATLLLAGLGARVIKIENPIHGDHSRSNAPYLGPDGVKMVKATPEDVSLSVLNRLRNKLGVTLNLKSPEARGIFADLLRKADVVVENFSYGTLDRLGCGYEFGRTVNPRIVYCSINGFGSEGEPGAGKAVDTIIQALSGIMFTSGAPDDPPIRVGVPVADLGAALFGVIGLLAALHQAKRSGTGQHVDISMLGSVTSLVACENYEALIECGIPVRSGQTMPRLAPFGIYRARDGYVAVCAPTDNFAQRLFQAMGLPGLNDDSRFHTRDLRVKNVRELDALIGGWLAPLAKADAVVRLEACGVPAAEVREPQAAVRDPRVIARGETVPLEHPKYGAVEELYGMGLPIRFSGASAGYDQPAPELGEHNAKVYGELLGYSAERIAQLKAQGVI